MILLLENNYLLRPVTSKIRKIVIIKQSLFTALKGKKLSVDRSSYLIIFAKKSHFLFLNFLFRRFLSKQGGH